MNVFLIFFYILAMFGGSYQYEPEFFFGIVFGMIVVSAVLYFLILRLWRVLKRN